MAGPESFVDQNDGMWQLLVDSVVDYAIYWLDLDGTIKSWNAGAERIKGYSQQEIIGSNFSRFYTDDDVRAGEPARSLEIARSVGRFEAQGWRVRKDGTRLWADVVIDVVRNPAGEVVGFAKVTRDITQRALRAETNDDVHLNAQVLVDNVLDYAVFSLDVDGTVKSWNAGAERIKGYGAQEIIGSNFSLFFTADDVGAGEPIRCLEIARTTGRFEGAGWRVCKDRKRVWVNVIIDVVRDVGGAVVGFAVITRDLTQSVALRAVTPENGSIAQTLVDNVVDYAIYLLDVDGTVKSWNAGAQRIKGYSAEEIIGRNFSTFFTDDDVRAGEPARSLALARKTGKFAAEGWRVRKDRTRLWASVMIDAVRDGAGEVVGFAKVTRDITQSAAVRYLTEQLRVEREQFLGAKKSADHAAAQAIASAEHDRLTAAKLVEQNRLMTMAERMVKVGYWRFDVRTQEIHWSDEVYRIHGLLTSCRPTLATVLDAFHRDDRKSVTESIERAMCDGAPYDFEARIVRADGVVRTILAGGQVVRDDSGTISGLFGAIQDITERRDIERERERLIVRVSLATQAAKVGIWDWEITTNAIVWDAMMFGLYGYDEGAFSPLYEHWTAAIHPDDRARAEREIAHAAQTGTPFGTEFRIVWPNGEIHHIQAKATIFCDAAGTAERMIGTNWDVTEVRTLAEQLEAAAERDRATAATLTEKNRFMAMAEQLAHIGPWRLDIRSNEVFWSDELYRTFDLPTTFKPTLENAIAVYHPDDRERVSRGVEESMASGIPYTGESRIVRPDGSIRHVVANGQPEYAADGSTIALFGVLADVTESKDAERDRLRLLERVRVAAQAGNVGIWEWDLRTDGVVWDATMFALYGLSERSGPQTSELWKRAFHPDDEEPITRAITDAIHGHTLLDVEYRVLWPNDETRYLRCRGMVTSTGGDPVRMLGTAWDVTEVRRLAIQLQEEKAELRELSTLQRAILTDAALGIIATDVHGAITLFNPAAERMLGYTTEEIVRRATPAPFHDPAEVEARAQALTAELQTVVQPGFEVFIAKARQGGADSNEWTYIRKDGTRFPVSLSVTALRDEDDNVFGYLGMFVDQTELQHDKRRLLETVAMWMSAKEAAEAATRAKSDFLANMSHEIRTPMNGIIGLTTLLLDDNPRPQQRQHLDLLADAGRSLLAIINDILDLSKVEAGKIDLEAIALRPASLVQGALALVQVVAREKGIALDMTIAPDVPDWVDGDPTRLRQILLNLLSNALKFTERGRVAVTVRRESQTGGDLLRFEISDTGIGIAAENRHLLFEKFSQVDRSDSRRFGGSGLGLAISRRLAETMSGTIGVTSGVGTGSVFWFTARLPLSAAATPVLAAAARRRTDVVARRILLVDDNPLNQIVGQALLAKEGHDVVVVADGCEALAAVQEHSFDLVLMDMRMPVMDGLEATRRIRELDTPVANIPIVALTANVMAEEVASCRAAGMNDHLAKPLDRDLLRQSIATWGTPTNSRSADDSRIGD
jgi:PAS domain S-box-containing protein